MRVFHLGNGIVCQAARLPDARGTKNEGAVTCKTCKRLISIGRYDSQETVREVLSRGISVPDDTANSTFVPKPETGHGVGDEFGGEDFPSQPVDTSEHRRGWLEGMSNAPKITNVDVQTALSCIGQARDRLHEDEGRFVRAMLEEAQKALQTPCPSCVELRTTIANGQAAHNEERVARDRLSRENERLRTALTRISKMTPQEADLEATIEAQVALEAKS
jgi:hypothetical protein